MTVSMTLYQWAEPLANKTTFNTVFPRCRQRQGGGRSSSMLLTDDGELVPLHNSVASPVWSPWTAAQEQTPTADTVRDDPIWRTKI